MVDKLITRVCKGLKYIYSIGHQHGLISSQAITYPDLKLKDKWAMKDIDHNDRDRQSMYAGDLFALGQLAKQMLAMSGQNPSQSLK